MQVAKGIYPFYSVRINNDTRSTNNLAQTSCESFDRRDGIIDVRTIETSVPNTCNQLASAGWQIICICSVSNSYLLLCNMLYDRNIWYRILLGGLSLQSMKYRVAVVSLISGMICMLLLDMVFT